MTSVKGTSLQFLCRTQYSEMNSSAGAVRSFLKETNVPECTPRCSMTVCAAAAQCNDGRYVLLISTNLAFSFTSDNRELRST
jgi:hypothetical protein